MCKGPWEVTAICELLLIIVIIVLSGCMSHFFLEYAQEPVRITGSSPRRVDDIDLRNFLEKVLESLITVRRLRPYEAPRLSS